ncbi:MAG: tol-pal system protein YbgF [Leptospirillia bacterium]
MTLRGFRLATAATALLMATGCATQANLVDLEEEVARVREQAGMGAVGPAATVGERVDYSPAEGSAPADASLLDLTVAMDQMRTEVSELRGQMDEMVFQVNSLAEQIDRRLTSLEEEAGIEQVPSIAGGEPSGPSVPDSAVAASQPADETVKTGSGVVLPGVMIAPRDQDVGNQVSAQTAYSLAEGDFKRGHYNLAVAGFANFIEQYPESHLVPDATFWLADAYRAQGLASRAVKVWEMEAEAFPRHKLTPKALLALGQTYRKMDNIPAAEEAFKRLIARFPVSKEAQQAKLILVELR